MEQLFDSQKEENSYSVIEKGAGIPNTIVS